MMKASKFIVGTAAALLPLAAAFAQSPPPTDPPAQMAPADQGGGATFESLDKDSDGRISKTEAAANENVTAQFKNYDKNGDGFIDRSEVTRANTPPATTQP